MKKTNKKAIIIPILALGIFSLCIGLGYFLTNNNKEIEEENNNNTTVETEEVSRPYSYTAYDFEDSSRAAGVTRVESSASDFKAIDGGYVEYYKTGTATPDQSGYHMETISDEASSPYMLFTAQEDQAYTWSISHRGRLTNDYLAIIAGPKQDVDPIVDSSAKKDQFSKIAKWITTNKYIDLDLFSIDRTATITVYTTPFAANGKFVGEATTYDTSDNGPYSLILDATHTEKWTVTILQSSRYWWNT